MLCFSHFVFLQTVFLAVYDFDNHFASFQVIEHHFRSIVQTQACDESKAEVGPISEPKKFFPPELLNAELAPKDGSEEIHPMVVVNTSEGFDEGSGDVDPLKRQEDPPKVLCDSNNGFRSEGAFKEALVVDAKLVTSVAAGMCHIMRVPEDDENEIHPKAGVKTDEGGDCGKTCIELDPSKTEEYSPKVLAKLNKQSDTGELLKEAKRADMDLENSVAPEICTMGPPLEDYPSDIHPTATVDHTEGGDPADSCKEVNLSEAKASSPTELLDVEAKIGDPNDVSHIGDIIAEVASTTMDLPSMSLGTVSNEDSRVERGDAEPIPKDDLDVNLANPSEGFEKAGVSDDAKAETGDPVDVPKIGEIIAEAASKIMDLPSSYLETVSNENPENVLATEDSKSEMGEVETGIIKSLPKFNQDDMHPTAVISPTEGGHDESCIEPDSSTPEEFLPKEVAHSCGDPKNAGLTYGTKAEIGDPTTVPQVGGIFREESSEIIHCPSLGARDTRSSEKADVNALENANPGMDDEKPVQRNDHDNIDPVAVNNTEANPSESQETSVRVKVTSDAKAEVDGSDDVSLVNEIDLVTVNYTEANRSETQETSVRVGVISDGRAEVDESDDVSQVNAIVSEEPLNNTDFTKFSGVLQLVKKECSSGTLGSSGYQEESKDQKPCE